MITSKAAAARTSILGGLGRDDIIGGSSDWFGLTTGASRPDGADTIFGGTGMDVARNSLGDAGPDGHGHDSGYDPG